LEAGLNTQNNACIAIGFRAGQSTQQAYAVSIGTYAGQSNNGYAAVAIGTQAGRLNQGETSISIGFTAGNINQNSNAIAIGSLAGVENQLENTIAIGYQAGYGNQNKNAIAIGSLAGRSNQSTNSIAIGYQAGLSTQRENSIIINATGLELNNTQANTLTIAPIRNDESVTAGFLHYNTTTKEVVYNAQGKTFVIQHPTNPEKHLVHACLEGPESGVYYRGTGTITDSSVVITLPDYVKHIASEFTVQVTPVYNGTIRTLNTSCVSNNSFTVYGLPGDFYWHVYGKRLTIEVEPDTANSMVYGDGPYRWIRARNTTSS